MLNGLKRIPKGLFKHSKPAFFSWVKMFSEKQEPIKKILELRSANGMGFMGNSVFCLFLKLSDDIGAKYAISLSPGIYLPHVSGFTEKREFTRGFLAC